MAEGTTGSLDTQALVVELNDLLRLDHDAIRAYGIARERLKGAGFRDVLERFTEDHERHLDEVTRLVRRYGGRPLELPGASAGSFQLEIEAVPAAAGDAELVLALKANARRARDAYRGLAQRAYPPEVAAVLRRAANDEAAHYVWALETLDDMSSATEGRTGRVERALGAANARAVRALDATDRRIGAAADRVRRELGGEIGAHPIRAALVALVAGLAAAAVVGGRSERA